VLILIKIACFGIWFTIMVFLSCAGRQAHTGRVKRVTLEVSDPEEAERLVRSALLKLNRRDRLVIKIGGSSPGKDLCQMVQGWVRKNPSILIKWDRQSQSENGKITAASGIML
jgi:hypothetical protein